MKFLIAILTLTLCVLGCEKAIDNPEKTALFFEGNINNEFNAYYGNELNNSTVYDSVHFSSSYTGANSYDIFDDSVRISFKSIVRNIIGETFELQISYSKYEDVNLLYNDSLSNGIKFHNYDLFFNILSGGTSPLLTGNFPVQNGIKIELYNQDGYWHSDSTSTTELHSNYYNSNFTIEKIEPFYSQLGDKGSQAIRVFADFSVTLYNDSKDSIRIENAKCAIVFTQ
jgi:hypothetical protein